MTIIDLSLLPTHVITTITAVVSRLVFDTLQRYRKQTKKCLPTVLVIEEAHHLLRDIMMILILWEQILCVARSLNELLGRVGNLDWE